jgi:hypothetical protein
MSDKQRGEESQYWFVRSRENGFENELVLEALAGWQTRIFQKRQDRELLDSLLSSEPISAESIVFFAAQIGQRSDNYTGFMLRKALQAQRSSQWEVAEQLYFLIEGKLTERSDILAQAKYLLNAGDFSSAEGVLSDITDNDPEVTKLLGKLRNRPRKPK